MNASSMVHVRVDDALKQAATEALRAMGLSLSDAVRMLMTRVVAERALPFEVRVPNAETAAAMRQARATKFADTPRFASPDAMFAELDSHAEAARKKRRK